ncbi:protein kinase [Sorangium sp. So ce327]|uniref:protein kinase domain-containing protein n=1 Tax=Sorangium sp. So ce327 TaxID=3133301 RepID=UPI003F607F40
MLTWSAAPAVPHDATLHRWPSPPAAFTWTLPPLPLRPSNVAVYTPTPELATRIAPPGRVERSHRDEPGSVVESPARGVARAERFLARINALVRGLLRHGLLHRRGGARRRGRHEEQREDRPGTTTERLDLQIRLHVFLQSLGALLRASRELLPLAEVAALFADILDGVGAAHASGIVHRDLKPENVLLAEQDGERVAKVVDFGLAHLDDPLDAGPTLTSQDMVAGTPEYMSPEQCRSLAVGPSTDLYVALLRLAPAGQGLSEACEIGLDAQGIHLAEVPDAAALVDAGLGVAVIDAGADVEGACALLEALGRAAPGVRAVVCASGLSSDRMNALVAAGAADVARYPVAPDALSRKIARVVRRGR